MKFKRTIRKLLILLKSYWFKKNNKSSVFKDKTVLFDRIKITNSTVGRYTYFAGKGCINNAIIGEFCSIADNVNIGVGIHPLNFISTHPIFYSSQTPFPYKLISEEVLESLSTNNESEVTYIGNDVWIGINAIILDGVSIGNGAVVGAGAVITKNVPDYAIVVGIPGKIIGYRTEVEKVDNKYWWELNDKVLVEAVLNSYKV